MWARQWPDTTVSTVLHACYLAYYAILLVPYARLALRQEMSAWRVTFRAHMITLLIGVVIFLLWPVEGPRFRAPIGSDVLPDAAHRVTNTLLATFSARGTAFPSSHVSIAVAHLLVAWTTQRALALVMAPVVLGLAIGAVYGGFHYLSDVLAGALLGVLGVLLSRRISTGAAAPAAT
jgi:membrane-associated phospholipid phosphatase